MLRPSAATLPEFGESGPKIHCVSLKDRRWIKTKLSKPPSDRELLIGNGSEPTFTAAQKEGYRVLGKLAQLKATRDAETASPVAAKAQVEAERDALLWRKVQARR